MKSAVTICLVEQARQGPFVFHAGLADGCAQAAALGFDAVEIFAPSPDAVNHDELKQLLTKHNLEVAAVGTGAGAVFHGLTLTHGDAAVRDKARAFIKSIIDMGAPYRAPAILGSMQGKHGGEVSKEQAIAWLSQAMNELGDYAGERGVPFIYEHLNRYETNLANTVVAACEIIEGLKTDNVQLLADLFHMNIEERDLAAAIRLGSDCIGHVHLADSNRQAAGLGHTNFVPIIAALREIGYSGYLSAEVFALPDSAAAAKQTIDSFNQLVRPD